MVPILFVITLFIFFALPTSAQVEHGSHKAKSVLRSHRSDQEVWIVYDKTTFGESELCRVLNCRKRDYCLVKGEDAICLHRKMLRDAPGHKVFYRKSDLEEADESGSLHRVRETVTKHSYRSQSLLPRREPSARPPLTAGANKLNDVDNAVEWDPDRVRQKLASYYRSVKRKQRNRAALARKNIYDTPSTFKENADGQRSMRPAQKKRCDQAQLTDIGNRLLQWFSDMQAHHDSNSRSDKQPRRQTMCRGEARWMFSQLDHDGNNKLDPDELHALTYDQYEPCIKPFLDQCDRNVDTHLSIYEWCVCFK